MTKKTWFFSLSRQSIYLFSSSLFDNLSFFHQTIKFAHDKFWRTNIWILKFKKVITFHFSGGFKFHFLKNFHFCFQGALERSQMIYNLGLYPYLSDTPKLDHLGIHGEWNNYKKKINFIYAGKKTREIQNLILFMSRSKKITWNWIEHYTTIFFVVF